MVLDVVGKRKKKEHRYDFERGDISPTYMSKRKIPFIKIDDIEITMSVELTRKMQGWPEEYKWFQLRFDKRYKALLIVPLKEERHPCYPTSISESKAKSINHKRIAYNLVDMPKGLYIPDPDEVNVFLWQPGYKDRPRKTGRTKSKLRRKNEIDYQAKRRAVGEDKGTEAKEEGGANPS